MLRLLYDVHQLLGGRRHEGGERVGGRTRHVLYPIQWPQDGGHLGELQMVDVHVDVELRNHLERRLLLLQLREKGPKDALADALAALQMEGAGDEVTEIVVPDDRVFLLCL